MKKPAILAALALLFAAHPGTAQEPNFGRAIVIDGDNLVVGQPVNWYGPGTVYTYGLGADGQWIERSLLTAPDSARKDDFGRTLAFEGNTLIVGAPRKLDGSGVVYAFSRASATAEWEVVGTLDAPGGAQPEYGAALALSGDELLIGSPEANGTGVVYRFVRSGGSWERTGMVSPPSDGVTGFGQALSLSGDRLLVGAPDADGGVGRAYIADRMATGWGTPRAVARGDGMSTRTGLGTSVLLTGDQAIVGAPGAGTAFVYESTEAGAWTVTLELVASGAGNGTGFGFSLAEAGDDLWVGAPNAAGDGRVFRFSRGGEYGWQGGEQVNPDETTGTSWRFGFGYAIAGSDERVMVGMPSRDFGEGRAMAFNRAASGWQPGELIEGRIFRLGDQLQAGDRCRDGQMAEFTCDNMELVAHVPIDGLGGERGVWVNDVWGWTDPDTGRMYALVARRDGASFLDVTNPTAPQLIGNLPRTEGSRPSTWRDIKVIGTHAYIVSDGAGAHGMQVFDLTRLRNVSDAPVDFEPETTYHEIFSAHNVVADTASGFVYVVGANSGGQTCGGGLHIVDVREPTRPAFAGCYNDPTSARGYTHDAQCLVYNGPDQDYRGRQICLGSNESELNIADVTNKSNPVTISRASYPNSAYAHQGWLDDEHQYFYMNDEGDESAGLTPRTRTMVWDLTDLDDPILVNEYLGPVPASDHNLFVVGDRMYQSNYGSGLRVQDISDRGNPREIGFFDSAPYNSDEPGFSATQSGAWSNYPFFPNGLVLFTSVREGLFLVRVTRPIS